MTTDEKYIPSARDAVIAFFGRNAVGHLRCYCATCNDTAPLSNAAKVYGDLYVATGEVSRIDEGGECDACGVALLSLSQSCQREHDEQQTRWARMARPSVLIEYGVPAFIRCRVY